MGKHTKVIIKDSPSRSTKKNSQLKACVQKNMEAGETLNMGFASNPLPMWIYDIETLKFIEVNNAASLRYGYTREEFGHLTLMDIRPAEEKDKLIDNIKTNMDAYQRSSNWIHKDKNGKLFPVEIISQKITYQDRSARLVVALDITERMRAEDALRASEEKYRLLAENISDVVWVLDTASMKFKYVSPSIEKLSGYTAAEAISKSFEEQLTSETFAGIMPKFKTRVESFLAGDPAATVKADEGQLVCKDGSVIWTETVSTILRNKDGGVDILGVSRNISKRKQTEKTLWENQERLQSFFENAGSLVWIKDLEGRFIAINKYAEANLGLPSERLLGRNVYDIFPEQDAEFYAANDKAVIESGQILDVEETAVLDGVLHTYASTKFPLRDPKGNIYALGAICTDITERKQIELALRESESRHRQISELTSDYIYSSMVFTDNRVQTVWVSGALEQITGYSLDEVNALPHGFIDIVFPEDLQKISKQNDAEKRLHGIEYRIRRKDGEIRWLLDRMKEIPAEEPNVLRKLIGAVRDITASKHIEIALRDSEEKYRHLATELEQHVQERTDEIKKVQRRLEVATKAAELGIWDWNVINNQLIFDEQMHAIYGTSPESFDQTIEGFIKIVHPDDAANLMSLAQAVLNGEQHYYVQYRIIREDKSVRHIKTYGTVLLNKNNIPEHVIGVVMDITQDKESEETLRLANLELERAMRVKDEFLANMSHELRTPLNSILGISESMMEEVAGDINEKQKKYLQIVSESGHHLLNLINDILDLSKIGAGRMELDPTQFSTEALCQSSLRMIKELAQKKRLNISFRTDDKVKTIYGDERRLKQVLVNLLSNAVKFSPEGESLGLEVTGNIEENLVTFCVWDTGIGISKQDLPRLFKPFVQLDSRLSREAGGTGLGLMLVAQLVRLHGGNVTVNSTPGKGSRFIVSLPWRSEEVTQTPEIKITNPTVQATPQTKSARILLVEDTETIILYMQDYLEIKGYHVTVARNGYEGVIFAKNLLPDIILMDIQMPSMDGFEATRRIRAEEHLKHTPIIALTALAMPGDREKCLKAGMNAYLSKPIDLKELQKLLQEQIKYKGGKFEQ
ncbi:MAG: PAS domain S-box protein [Anaerolineales bacterium]